MMTMLVCIPMDVDAATTARSVIRSAAKAEILALARSPEKAAAFFREMLNADTFLVRAPEAKKGDDKRSPDTSSPAKPVHETPGGSGVG